MHAAPSEFCMHLPTIGRICKLVRSINLASSNNQIKGEGALKRILARGEGKSPAERGSLLEKDEDLTRLHDESSNQGQSAVPDREEEVDLHFVALVDVGGELYEMDGRKPWPIHHGKAGELLQSSVAVIKKFMAREPGE
ncbi:Ubiquitin carboxyl-terminal hydrolase isozyme L3 [Phlyctochytrium planicorne]|nr:Ubiquitin carboxyl-terminal hydrolase isozyme L3 [Phlyctochytrium planicorne]